jgi:eukaryotic-like serine/threonine-protein kinase
MLNKTLDDDVVMSLVELALLRSPDEREAYVQSVCAEDPELFRQVWEYIQWEQRMNGFLLEPLYAPPSDEHPFEHPFEPGDLLDDRFRIVREVAQGGMGIVYEATDEKLERRIALKCGKIGFRKRLPPEVRNATAISHPNVCKIFEIHTANTRQGEIDFLTMEFLDGQTLADRLRTGPLPALEARTIALQLCAGLAEAHRNHVVHGDLKSGNVILTNGPEGTIRAVITDFGLARKPEAGQRTAQSGPRGGTPDYMAPELWKGEGASPASDVYALGVILYELVSGRPPHTPETSWQARLTQKPPAVDSKWDRVLARCIDPDPTKRFQDAQEVAQALAPPRSRRWFLAATAAAVLALATGVVTYRSTVPSESVRLAMLPLQTDPSIAPLAENMFRDAGAQLARLKGRARTSFTVIPGSKIERDHVDTPEKAQALFGATHVLQGTLTKENEKIVVHAYVTDVRNHATVKDWTAEYAPGALRYAPTALVGVVTGTLRLPPIAAAVVASARQDYLNGVSAVRYDSGVDTAVASLKRAVTADPDSPLTYAGLAEAEWFKYYLTKGQNWLDQATESARQAEIRNPDLAPTLRIAGILDANAGRYQLAEAEYRRAIELEPGNSDGYRRLAQVLERDNQRDEALQAFSKAIEADPGYYRNYQAIGAFYFGRANYVDAVKAFRKTVELAPREPNAHYVLAATYLNLGRFAEAQKEFGITLGLEETPNALYMMGHVLTYQGKDREAISYLSQAVGRLPERYLYWMSLGIAYRRVNLKAESDRANRRALELAEVDMTRDPRNAEIRSHIAYLCARLGDRSRAESEIAQALQLSPNDGDARWMAAITYEALGQRDKSLAILSTSPAGVLADVSRWPDVADLRADPRFIELLASHPLK